MRASNQQLSGSGHVERSKSLIPTPYDHLPAIGTEQNRHHSSRLSVYRAELKCSRFASRKYFPDVHRRIVFSSRKRDSFTIWTESNGRDSFGRRVNGRHLSTVGSGPKPHMTIDAAGHEVFAV